MHLIRTLLLMKMMKPLWVLYLAVAVLFVQSGRLHVHVYDHEPASSNHAHQEQAHFHHDVATEEHPGKVAEIDLSLQAFLKTFSSASLIFALLPLVVFICVFRLLSPFPWPSGPRDFRTALRYGLRPPLRAPPL